VPDFTFPITATFDVPSALNTVETHYFQIPNVPTFLNLPLEGRGLTYTDLTSIISSYAEVSAIGINLDLDFVHKVIVNVYDEDTRTELFYFENIPFGNKTEIVLLASISELQAALAKEFVNIEVGMRFRQFPPQSFKGQITMDFSAYTDQ
jgi:hypothetical protein